MPLFTRRMGEQKQELSKLFEASKFLYIHIEARDCTLVNFGNEGSQDKSLILILIKLIAKINTCNFIKYISHPSF